MADLDRKLRSLDQIPAPDLWFRVGVPSGRRPSSLPSPIRRVAIVTVALSLSIAAFAFAYVGLRDDRVDLLQPGHPTMSVSGSVRQGTLICTVTASAVVEPGDPLNIAFAVENVSDRTREISAYGSTSYVVSDADGVAYDSEAAYQALGIFGPMIPPTEIAPGAIWRSGADPLLVRWDGPLTVTPTCVGTALPALTLDVAVPGPTPTVAGAIEGAAHTNGDLLGTCMPVDDGVPTVGTIRPPTPAKVPDMSASCSATVTLHDGFAVVRVVIVTPPEEQGVDVANPYFLIALPDDRRSIEVIVWDVVVTRDRATVVGGRAIARTEPSDGTSVGWMLTGTRWEGPTKAGSCGTQTTVGGPGFIQFINTCPSVGGAPFG